MSAFHFLTTAELRMRGYTVQRIRDEIGARELERVIKGWYATPGADREAVRAMRLGARLGCVSALRLYGAWMPPDVGMHLMFASHASGRRLALRGLPPGAVTHWQAPTDATGSAFPVAPIELATAQMLECQPPQVAVAVLDSLGHRGLMHPNRIQAVIARGPERVHELAEHLDPRSEEGIESLVRFALRSHGVQASVQVILSEQYRVDLLIDGWLVVEVDGRGTHALQRTFTEDQVRVAMLMRGGRLVVRFAYATVIYDIDFVVATVRSVMDQHAPVG